MNASDYYQTIDRIGNIYQKVRVHNPASNSRSLPDYFTQHSAPTPSFLSSLIWPCIALSASTSPPWMVPASWYHLLCEAQWWLDYWHPSLPRIWTIFHTRGPRGDLIVTQARNSLCLLWIDFSSKFTVKKTYRKTKLICGLLGKSPASFPFVWIPWRVV